MVNAVSLARHFQHTQLSIYSADNDYEVKEGLVSLRKKSSSKGAMFSGFTRGTWSLPATSTT